tara:strand:- start:297 stop:539 length:243 start_codon:yes stop_codon:yes gene_type:complete
VVLLVRDAGWRSPAEWWKAWAKGVVSNLCFKMVFICGLGNGNDNKHLSSLQTMLVVQQLHAIIYFFLTDGILNTSAAPSA